VCLQVSRVNHDCLRRNARGRQSLHDVEEGTHFASSLPSVVERLVWTMRLRCIAPAQSVAVDENYAAQRRPIINPWLVMALGKVWLEPRHLLVGQPVQAAHIRSPYGA
jgi:hypothetical protein